MAGFNQTGPGGYIIDDAPVTVNNFVETPLFRFTMPGGMTTVQRILEFEVQCVITTAALTVPTLTIRWSYGGVVVVLASGLSLALSQAEAPFTITGKLNILGKTLQYGSAAIEYNSVTAQSRKRFKFSNDISKDQELVVSAQFGGISVLGTNVLIKEIATLELK